MTVPIEEIDRNAMSLSDLAVFLDFDGVLVEIEDTPEAVRLAGATRQTLEMIKSSTGGALAIVSGREIAQIDSHLHPLRLPVAGMHGLERRDAFEGMHKAEMNGQALLDINEKLAVLVDAETGLLLEKKASSTALHYRNRPDLEEKCLAVARDAMDEDDDLHLVHGKMVIEIKAGTATKADAVLAFMEEKPFTGRMPFYAGDDVTDEDAFAAIAKLDGISVKVGPGETTAGYRAQTTQSFLSWLRTLAEGHA